LPTVALDAEAATIDKTDSSDRIIDSPPELGFRRLLRHSAAFAVGDVLARGFGLLLLPVYVAFLRPEDFGTLAVSGVVASIATVLFGCGLTGASLRFYYHLDETTRRQFYGTVWLFLLLAPGLFLAVVESLHGAPFNWLLREIPYAPYIRLALWTAYSTVVLLAIPQEVLRASSNSAGYAALNAGQFAVAAGLTVWFLVILRAGVEGALWARLGGVVIVGLVGIISLRSVASFSLNAGALIMALAYGLPLVPHFLAHWVLSASDRIILAKFVSLADVGVYSVGYQIGSVMMLFATAGNNSLIPLFGRLDLVKHKEVAGLMRIITYYVLALTFLALAIAMFAEEFIRLLPASYGRAASVVPWVVFGYLFMALYYPAIDVLNLVLGDTKRVAATTVLAAGVNITLNIILVPRYGMIAAAVTTTITYMLAGLLVFSLARSFPLPYEYGRLAAILAAGVAAYAFSSLAAVHSYVVRIPIKGLAMLGFLILLWVTGFFLEPERTAVRRLRTVLYGSVQTAFRRLRGAIS